MGRTLTNNTGFNYGIEPSLGADPSNWEQLEPGDISRFGAEIRTVARDPISKTRQRRKGTVVDLDSGVEFETDLTLSAFRDFIEGFVFAQALNGDVTQLAATAAANTNGDYTLSAALVAGQIDRFVTDVAGRSLIWVSGFTTSSNNGLKAIDVDATASTTLSVSDTLTDETGATAFISFAGHRVADGESVTWSWDSGASQATLTVTGLGTLLQALNLTPGQFVHIGSIASLGGAIQNAFDDSGTNDAYGYCRVVGVEANAIVFDKVDSTLQKALTDPGELDIVFGEFVRNVTAGTADYLTRSFMVEVEFPELGDGTPGNTDDAYQYAKGNYCNEVTINLPLTDKVTMTVGMAGTDTDNPTTSRKAGASSASAPTQTAAFNTTSDYARLRMTEVDEDGLLTDFKTLSLTLRNNVTPVKVQGTLGAKYIGFGNIEVDIEAEALFTSPLVINKIRDNETVTMEIIVTNDDGAIALDFPSMTLGGGGRSFPRNEPVQISTTAQTHQDNTLGTSIGVSLFPVPLP